jgi:mono/diheme cytochrome c family protein
MSNNSSKRSQIFFSVMFSFFIAVAVISCNKTGDTSKSATTTDSTAKNSSMTPADRGKYLVNAVAGCGDCHTPWKMGAMGPEPDMSRMLSGHPAEMKMPPPPKMGMPWMAAGAATFTAWSGPWGISYTANLTPDSTGLGSWKEEDFIRALRTGIHIKTGRPLLPPMPWPNFKNMTDDDLKAIFAYLRTIPPVHNQVPDAVINMPPPGMAGGPPAGAPPTGGSMKK